MTNKISKISGKLIQGVQKAAFFAELSWVQQQCRKKIGFVPFPGTLNIEINKADVELLKSFSDHCVYVGDMGIDITAGKAAGMKTIGVLTGFETRQDLENKNPDAIIESISDLPYILGISSH